MQGSGHSGSGSEGGRLKSKALSLDSVSMVGSGFHISCVLESPALRLNPAKVSYDRML